MDAPPPPDSRAVTGPTPSGGPAPPLPVVGPRFVVLRRIGEGGMGVVYEAFDKELGAKVALKSLRTLTADGVFRIKTEFRALADIQHRNLVRFGELFEHQEQWFFTMELLDGVSFLEHVRPGSSRSPGPGRGGGILDEERLRAALGQLARGLVALHDAGKVHRDMKHSNVLVTRDGRVVILDFGIVASVRPERWQDEDELVGTFAYMAPEQARGEAVGVEVDWYSVGVMLYEALTGRLPHVGTLEEVLAAKQLRTPPSPRAQENGVPLDLDHLCMDLLRIEPHYRPSDRDVLERLRAWPSVLPGPLPKDTFVGRARELAKLREAYEETRGPAGHAVTVLLQGESGVGKSALARHFANTLEQALVFAGRCYEREWVPYKAFDGVVDALSGYLAFRADARTLLPRELGILGLVFPVLHRVGAIADASAERGEGSEAPDPQSLRERVFAALRELFSNLSARGPVVLVVDDMQWADADSIALLSSILRPPDAPSLLLVATCRAGEAAAALVRELPGVVRTLPVESLSQGDAETLVETLLRAEPRASGASLAGGAGDDVSAAAIAKEAAGHPLFIDELVRSRLQPRRAGAPLRLDDALGARVERLDSPTLRVLHLVALAGAPLALEVVARAAGGAPSNAEAPQPGSDPDASLPEEYALFAERVALLRGASFVRTTGALRTDRIEPYHDRVRETVARRLADDERRGLHEALAAALEASDHEDAEALALHWRSAGNRAKALEHTLRAASRAVDALAFDRAAHLYGTALELDDTGGADRTALRVRLADALANAGRGPDAARAYLDAARESDAARALDLRRRAAEQLLRAGQVDEAIATFGMVLEEVGMAIPKTQRGALASLLLRRAQVRVRGLRFEKQSPAEIPPRDLLRIDAAWMVGAGLGLVDTIVGSFFTTRGLLLALEAGEPGRICRAIASEAAFSSAAGGPTHERTMKLVRMAEEIASGLGSPYATAWSTGVSGIAAALEGRWSDAHAALDRAEKIFRERCTGVAWEIGTMRWFSVFVLAYLGRIDDLSRLVPARLHEARARGDLYAEVSQTTGQANLVWLAADDPARARELCLDVMKRWSRDKFHVEHWWAMHAEAQSDLYEGRGVAALTMLNARWPALRASLLLMCQMTRSEAVHVRARAALIAAKEDAARSASYLSLAEADARALAKEHMPWSDPLAALLRAAVASFRADDRAAMAELDGAVTGLEAAHMGLFATAARWRRGELRGGDAGQDERRRAEEWLHGRGLVNPARMVSMLAPWK